MNNPDSFPQSYKAFGEGALLVEWPAQINQNTLFDILRLQSAVESKLGDALVETVNAYHSLTIIFNPETLSFEGAVKKVQSLYPERPPLEKLPRNLWAVPVCYDMEYGIDLEEVAHLHLHQVRLHVVFDIAGEGIPVFQHHLAIMPHLKCKFLRLEPQGGEEKGYGQKQPHLIFNML